KDDTIVAEVLRIFRYRKQSTAISNRIGELVSHKTQLIRYLAIENIGLHKSNKFSNQIIRSSKSEDEQIRRISLWSIRKIRSQALLQYCRTLLKETNELAIYTSTFVLGYNQDKHSLFDLVKSMEG